MQTAFNTDLVVLGAGKPTGFGSAAQSKKMALNQRALEWVKHAVQNHVHNCHFVAGFGIEEAGSNLSGFRIELNPQWRETGSARSLMCAPVAADHQVLACYADIVFRESAVQRLLEDRSDICLLVDSAWKTRFAARTQKDLALAEKVQIEERKILGLGSSIPVETAAAEFVGVVKLSPRVMAELRRLEAKGSDTLKTGGLPDVIELLIKTAEFSVSYCDVKGDWAELNAPQDLARFVLGTKAETLSRLKPLVQTMRVESQVRFTVKEWEIGRQKIIGAIRSAFPDDLIIIRSSARSEDSWNTANAGVYKSLPNIDPTHDNNLTEAINEVIDSYGARNDDDQILVQPMLKNVIANGVIFTRTLNHGAPYFVINYDETEGCTDAVTAGAANLKILYMHYEATHPPAGAPIWTTGLVAGARELIDLVGYDTLDIEFAVLPNGDICLLQLRPIAVNHDEWAIDDDMLSQELRQAVNRYRRLQTPAGSVPAGHAVIGVMPDWNPAEIVGTRPSLLSISLYRRLICDHVWAQQRADYGYRDVRPQPLIASFAGRPYVNVRASFASFIPATISDDLAAKLVDHYIARLVTQPALHDKIEFNIAFTCLSFDFETRANAELTPAGFSDDEIRLLRSSLADITKNGLARCSADLAMIDTLAKRYDAIMQKPLDPLERACALLDDCQRFGTLPFAHLARSGFIAATLMRSAVSTGLIDRSFLETYFNATHTVAKNFVHEGAAVAAGRSSWDEFVDRYGHLRPGTYDITSPAYHEDSGRLLREALKGLQSPPAAEAPKWPKGAWRKMQTALRELGLQVEQEEFERFIKEATEGREFAKFVFSRNLSRALDDLVKYGQSVGLDRATLADAPIDAYFSLRAGENFGDPVAFIRKITAMYASRKMIALNAELPPLIHDESQFYSFFLPPSEPNFITSKSIKGEVAFLVSSDGASAAALNGKIVVIPQADPGYDWLFGCNIAGLITQYGGANSHMAIRAAEFSLPAAIGVGELMFEQLQHARILKLDCLNRKIDIFDDTLNGVLNR